jgi:16S rRNA (adenine1518-N6/adenine1519-N6)-dimethyltransferase
VVARGLQPAPQDAARGAQGLSPEIEDHLRAAGIDPTERAEQVSLEGFCALARARGR